VLGEEAADGGGKITAKSKLGQMADGGGSTTSQA